MPRLEHLENLNQNKTYQVNATIKYLHRGENSMTGILEQENAQSKFCIRNTEFPINEGYEYNFEKCFYSSNGWLYPRNPNTLIHQNCQQIIPEPLQLQTLYENRNQLANHYLSVALFVANVNPRKTIKKHEETLTLDTLTCFGNGVLIDLTIWNQNIPKEIENRWMRFDGFRLKFTGPDSMILTSSVYSKM